MGDVLKARRSLVDVIRRVLGDLQQLVEDVGREMREMDGGLYGLQFVVRVLLLVCANRGVQVYPESIAALVFGGAE